MRRRRFLGLAGAGAAAATAAFGSAPALAQSRREVRIVTAWPIDYPGFGSASARLAKRITLLTGGGLVANVIPPGELTSAFGSFDAVATGEADMYHGIESDWQGKSPAFAFFASVPLGLTPQEMLAWIDFGGGQDLWDELSAGFGIKPMLAGHTGLALAGWFNREIKSVDDLRGLKVAVTGLAGNVLRRLGASAVALPGRQLAQALKDKSIDAAQWFGPWTALILRLYESATHCYYPGVLQPGTALALGVNLKFWGSLTLTQQQAIEAAAAAETTATLAEFDANNAAALQELRDRYAVQPRKLPDEVLRALGEAAGAVVAEAGASGALTTKVYSAFIDFRHRAMAWSRPSLHGFLDARLLPFTFGR